MGLFDDKVVAITGAGGGLGRAYALDFAREGARVVVNDLGGAADGSGSGTALADQVVAEIREAGGKAVANYDSVATREGAENIVRTAVEAFGRLDIFINNAGILRDKTLVKMTDEMWDIVLAVHLKGTYLCSQAAVRQMLEQGEGGRIINTSSLAGLKGNFGQTNYGAAKAGIAGFTRVLSLEVQRRGITVNCVAPVAKTRLTDDIDLVPEDMTVETISPMVQFLASDLASDVTGRIFGTHGGHYFEYLMESTEGVDKGTELWTPLEVRDRLDEISMTKAQRVKAKMAAAPAAGAADPAAKGLAVLEAIASAFMPDRAGDWKANLNFVIEDVGDYTMVVDGGCSVSSGQQGTPTCVIKMDDATFFGMARGQVDAAQAFMQGKITATNMGDMIKYGAAFHAKKSAAAATAALDALEGGAAEVTPEDKGFAVLQATSTAFMPERAGDWKATMHFVIEDCGEFTMAVADGSIAVERGLQGTATCVVKMEADTLYGMGTGEIDGNQAFMQGKITATNMGDMIKYGTSFNGKKAVAAVKAALAELEGGPAEDAVDDEPAAPEGLNQDCLGKKLVAPPFYVTPDKTVAYALATNDPNPYYVDEGREGGRLAPPLFPVRIMFGILGQFLTDPELNADLMMLLHGEQELTFYSPIVESDLIESYGVLTHMEQKASGEVFDVVGTCTRDGVEVAETWSRFFIRSRSAPRRKGPKPPPPELPELLFSAPMTVRPDQTIDYAAASGDDNPIHLDEEVAKAAGLKGRILHGLCTMAFGSQAIVNGAAGGDPTRLKRIKVRFTKPVHLGETITTQAWVVGQTDELLTLGFQMVNQDGVAVVTNGEADVAIA